MQLRVYKSPAFYRPHKQALYILLPLLSTSLSTALFDSSSCLCIVVRGLKLPCSSTSSCLKIFDVPVVPQHIMPRILLIELQFFETELFKEKTSLRWLVWRAIAVAQSVAAI